MVNFGSFQFKLSSCSSMPLLSYARCFKPSTLAKHAQAASHRVESLEAEERAPFQPTSMDEYLSPTEDETDLSRSVRRMSVSMPTGSGSAGSSAQSHGDDETTKVSHKKAISELRV